MPVELLSSKYHARIQSNLPSPSTLRVRCAPSIDGDEVEVGVVGGATHACKLRPLLDRLGQTETPVGKRVLCRVVCACRPRVHIQTNECVYVVKVIEKEQRFPSASDIPFEDALLKILPHKVTSLNKVYDAMDLHDTSGEVRKGYDVQYAAQWRTLHTHAFAVCEEEGVPCRAWIRRVLQESSSIDAVHDRVCAYPYQSARAIAEWIAFIEDCRCVCSHIQSDDELLDSMRRLV